MRLAIQMFVGLGIAMISTLLTCLEAVHFFDLIEQHIPDWIKPMISPEHNLILFGVGWLLAAAAWVEYRHALRKHDDESHSTGAAASNTASSVGNVLEQHQHFHLPDYPMGDFAKALAGELKTGAAEKFSAANIDDEQTQIRIVPGDGFVQLENLELQVQAVTQQVGQTISVKYFYANRGGLPVYEVQTWGLLVILDPAKNSGPHMKSLMLASARDGHQKFPGAATLGVQQTGFAFAPLPEPFTQAQIDALSSQNEALFFLVCGVWKDNREQLHYWSACRKALLPASLNVEKMNWLNL